MEEAYLFMILLGCRPAGRNTEQHDVFFGIGASLEDLIPSMKRSWPESKGNIHIDAWRKVTVVDGHSITVRPSGDIKEKSVDLYFINLGGYKAGEFDEFHYKMVVAANDLDEAKSKAKKTAFFKHNSVSKSPNTPNATAHIDDKFGVDVDDAYKLDDILPVEFKEKYHIHISPKSSEDQQDDLHLGYFKLTDL